MWQHILLAHMHTLQEWQHLIWFCTHLRVRYRSLKCLGTLARKKEKKHHCHKKKKKITAVVVCAQRKKSVWSTLVGWGNVNKSVLKLNRKECCHNGNKKTKNYKKIIRHLRICVLLWGSLQYYLCTAELALLSHMSVWWCIRQRALQNNLFRTWTTCAGGIQCYQITDHFNKTTYKFKQTCFFWIDL